MIKEAIGRYANLSRINLTKTNKKINAVADHLTTLYRFNPKSQPYRTFASLTGNSVLSTTFATLVRNSDLTTTFATLTGNSDLTTTFATLTGNSDLTATFVCFTDIFHLSSGSGNLVPFFHNLCQLSRIISLYFAHFGANSSRLVVLFYLSAKFSP